MNSYSILAKYYDRLMGDFDYEGYIEFVGDKLVGEGADLACGSGGITIALAKLGRKMCGVDISGQMLNEATLKAKKEGLSIVWIKQDITELELAHKVDFITCVCDGVNYIPKDKIKDFFARVKSFLKQGGKFVFDVSSEYKLKSILADNLFCEDYDDVTYIWSNSVGGDYVDMEIDFFEKVEGDTYRRIGESHRQYAHTLKELQKALVGWKYEIYDGENYSDVDGASRRLLFVATPE